MFVRVFKRGFLNGIQITWELAKAIIPVYFIITFLKYTHALDWISEACQPFMHVLGLPGEASLPLVLGNALTLYPAIGAIEALAMDVKQITIISVMLLFSHSLFLELAVSKKAGVKVAPILILRVVTAVTSALLLNIIL
ncbi:MAG: nucleoside recognition protein [Clostridia bacterium]|nr:nucleoside recognition protein [Clostridia bacterium]